ncbi:MAG: acetamidase/formamidase family protein [Firmicutes bacterium]|nr:acetamidase/formamidase family protein [Bacillota bacterium]
MKIVNNKNVIYTFKPKMASVERVRLGERFRLKLNDGFQGQIKSEFQKYHDIDESKIGPATGPVFIEGAKPGDLLKIEILDIDVGSEGVALIMPGEGVLGSKVARTSIRLMPVKNGHLGFGDLLIPVRPMIGIIGVAPSSAEGEFSTLVPWKHGGNMDTTDIGTGSTLFLPVSQEGALLAVGDCHAAMGDGEVGVSGCEIAAAVTLSVDLIKGKATAWPLLETSDYTMVVASGITLEEAIINAVDTSTEYLRGGLGISWEDAYILSSLVVDIKISQVVNPRKTVRAAIPKSLLKTDSIINSAPSQHEMFKK